MTARASLPRIAGADWLERPETQAVFAAVTKGGHVIRAVGGAVRNALLGQPVKDVDLATTARPEEVADLAQRARLKVIPTGLAHGTVTVVSGGAPYEVTTLRRDVETFGRHARVAFADDWTEDAARRDFTMNALYCDPDGTVFDPLGGYPDLAVGRVRFIGDARARIREDYLRILRLFRFYAEYGEGPLDSDSLAACEAERKGLRRISGERIRVELLRLLAAPRAVEAAVAMSETRVLPIAAGQRNPAPRFFRLIEIERRLGRAPDPVLRLGALAVAEASDVEWLIQRLRPSNAEAERLSRATGREEAFDPAAPEAEAKRLLYRIGPDAYTDGALLAWARSNDPIDDARRRVRLDLPNRWTAPAMPFRGADLLALGVPPGPEIGRILTAFEAWWIAEDFPSDPARLRAKLLELASRPL